MDVNDTRCSQAVTYPSINRAQCCLTSVPLPTVESDETAPREIRKYK